jgi:hypothetical protein
MAVVCRVDVVVYGLLTRGERIMGWASGSELFIGVIAAAKKWIPDDNDRENFYRETIPVFEQHDWDTQTECLGDDPAYDAALEALSPDFFQDEDED